MIPRPKTDGGVRGGTPSLTKNPFIAGKPDDIVNREEIRLVLELPDELKLMLHESRHFLRYAFRPAPPRAFLSQNAQMVRRSPSLGHKLAGILVAKLVERELDALKYRERFAQEVPRINPGKLVKGPEHALRVRMKCKAQSLDGFPVPNRRQGVLQHSPLTAVHMHVAARHQG